MSYRCISAVLFAVLLPPAALGDAGKGAFHKGERAEDRGSYDEAAALFKQASALSPKNETYVSAYVRARFVAATQHLHAGLTMEKSGALKEAAAEFQKAAELDPTMPAAEQELKSMAELLSRKDQKQAAHVEVPYTKLPDDVGNPVELKSLSNAPVTMFLTANADSVYKSIGKLAGLNVLIDPDYKPQKITVDLTNVTLREALDLVRLQSKTFWRPVLPNAIFVTSDSPTKRKEMEQSVMKTFYLKNVESPTELQDAANTLRQMLDLTRVQLVQPQDAIILRGTPDQVALAESLLSELDRPRSEVVIDVAVMEVSRDRIRTLGTTPPTSFSGSLVPPSSSSGGSGSSSGFTLSQLSHLSSNSLVFGIPGASFTALASDSHTKVLQNPEIRVLNSEKATLRIGDRVPYATGSFQPGVVGGGAVSPLIGTQFQYLDVGVNIDITPHVHSDGEITLKLSLEISSVTGEDNIGGISEPVIGQRRIEHETRLNDGEVSLLAGILEDTETQSMSGYPWVSKIPILRYLFAQDDKERKQNEIVFAITPHIVRVPGVKEASTRGIEVGTGNSIELRREAKPQTQADGSTSAVPRTSAPPATPSSSQPVVRPH